MMKKSLILLAAMAAVPLFQSCVAPGGYGYESASYGYSSPGYAVTAGILNTSHPRWGYDPYYRSYYDYSLGQYYNLNSRSYYTTLPRRYSSPHYPTGYRHGSVVSLPQHLPHLDTSYRHRDQGFVRTNDSRWAYDPYRRSYFDQQRNRYYNHQSGRYYNNLPQRHTSPQYPSNYRRGQPVQVHQKLPYVNPSNRHSQQPTHSSFQHGNRRGTSQPVQNQQLHREGGRGSFQGERGRGHTWDNQRQPAAQTHREVGRREAYQRGQSQGAARGSHSYGHGGVNMPQAQSRPMVQPRSHQARVAQPQVQVQPQHAPAQQPRNRQNTPHATDQQSRRASKHGHREMF